MDVSGRTAHICKTFVSGNLQKGRPECTHHNQIRQVLKKAISITFRSVGSTFGSTSGFMSNTYLPDGRADENNKNKRARMKRRMQTEEAKEY